jgi:predicted LPLAT superfamily acyltransferase
VADWRQIPEAGTVLGLRFVVFIARVCRRRVAGWFLYLVCLYFVLFRGAARRASRDYLRRVGQPDGLGSVIHHLHTFAQVSLDRLFHLTGRWESFEIVYHGHELFLDAARSGRGALLLGAHVGSFEVMRCRAQFTGVPINAVVDYSNAQGITSVLKSLAPGSETRLLPLGRDPLATVLDVKGCIERGELVAILGDRVSNGGRADRPVMVRFLDGEAPFPGGPWILAHALKCPVYFFVGLYTPPNRYDLYCELLADEVTLDRQARDASVQGYAQAYAASLERHVRLAPDNWFNFYEFWSSQ